MLKNVKNEKKIADYIFIYNLILQNNTRIEYKFLKKFLGQHLWSLKPLNIYHPIAIIGVFFLTIFLMQISPILLYAYGYNQYILNINNFNQQKQRQKTFNQQIIDNNQSCCDGYGTHIAAIFILLLIVIAKSSTLYALTILYQVNI